MQVNDLQLNESELRMLIHLINELRHKEAVPIIELIQSAQRRRQVEMLKPEVELKKSTAKT